jgi:hypothetical protein
VITSSGFLFTNIIMDVKSCFMNKVEIPFCSTMNVNIRIQLKLVIYLTILHSYPSNKDDP